MDSNPRVILCLRRAIACLLRVCYAFDLINALASLCSSLINNILVILSSSTITKLSLSLYIVIGPNNNRHLLEERKKNHGGWKR
ncbi:hypothetical protein CMV_029696 [Castanea mollissima]|uniref:Uncharacterized protein n=1 Tax=Castanea mollissima TaxID=60419 RepID=A0A8J4QE15_9ROSI|nr:hypothetical protein CMV_029696 [Castanea mollissima]